MTQGSRTSSKLAPSVRLFRGHGKPFTLWLTDEANESAVFSGVARWDGSQLFLDRSPKPQFESRSEWHARIQPVANEVEKT